MSASAVFESMPGVRGCVVADTSGRVFEETGAGDRGADLASGAAALLAELGRAGARLGLGSLDVVTTRSPEGAWVVGSHADWAIGVEMDANHPTDAVESELRSAGWSSGLDWEEPPTNEPFRAAEPAFPPESAERESQATIGLAPADAAIDAARDPASEAASDPARPTLVPPDSSASSVAVPQDRETAAALPADGSEAEDFDQGESPTYPFSESSIPIYVSEPPPEPSGEAPVFTGDLKMFPLVDLLEFLGNARRTGTLACTADDDRRGTIQLRMGFVIAASVEGGKDLEDVLVLRGVTTERELGAVAMANGASSGRALGLQLVEREILALKDVRAALEEQIRSVLADILSWSGGQFALEPRPVGELSELERELEWDSRGLLLEILRQQDEAAAND